MAIKLNCDQQKELLDELKSLPRCIVIAGELQSKLEYSIPPFDFIVDAWPNFKALLLRPSPGETQNTLMVYARDPSSLKSLLEQEELVDWSRKVKFAAVDTRLYPTVYDVVRHHKQSVKCSEDFCILTVTRRTLKLRQVPGDVTLSSLHPEQSDLVNSNWIRRGEGTSEYIRTLLETFPSCCLYNWEGDLLGYVLAYHYGCIGMLHVPEQHRGQGYAKIIVTQLADKCLQTSDKVYVVIEASNSISLQLHQNLGFEIIEDFRVRWISAR